MSKVGGHNGDAGDPGGGRAATVHELEAARARHEESVTRQTDHTPDLETPDRSAALNMLGTFDLDGIDVPSPDEVLATVEGSAAASRNADMSAHPPTEESRSPPTPTVSKTSTATRSSASSMSTIIVDSEPFGHAHRSAPPSYTRALGAPGPERRGGPSALTVVPARSIGAASGGARSFLVCWCR